MMAVCNLFSWCVCYRWKAYICSLATAILVMISVSTAIMFTFKSNRFFMRTVTYQERPIVNFKNEYVMFFEDTTPSGKKLGIETLTCSSIQKTDQTKTRYNYCPMIKAYEEDLDGDGLNDVLHFNTRLFVPPGGKITGMSVILLFDYKLSSFCQAQFEGVAFMQETAYLPGAGITITGDLGFVQRQPLSPWGLDTRYNETIMPKEHDRYMMWEIMSDALMNYAFRNMSTILTNVYTSWDTKQGGTEPFLLNVTIIYAEAIVRYTPTTWQVVRYSWAVFFSVLIVSVYILAAITDFIFSNHLTDTNREQPFSLKND